MKSITAYTIKTKIGYMGKVRIQDGDFITVESTKINRPTRNSALIDAKWIIGDLNLYK